MMRRGLGAFERQWNYDASYLREMIDVSPRAVWRFAQAARLGSYRGGLPIAAWAAAAIYAVRQEDCGPCTQLSVDMAASQGVDADVLRAVLTENPDAMPPEVALAWRFARATLAHDPAADELREQIVERWGQEGVVSLAFAIITAKLYPTVKYAMGHGKACTRIVVGGSLITFDHAVAFGRAAS
jgi:hypothetical protein